MRPVWICVVLLVVTGCRAGDAGTLEPIDGGTISNDGVAVRSGAVVATVAGQWAAEASQAVQLRYTNRGSTPVNVKLAPLRLHRNGEVAELWSVSDMTVVNRADARTDNDVPPTLYDAGPDAVAPVLTVRAGEQRALAIGFTNFTGDARIRSGEIVTLDLPMPGGTRTVRFRAR